MKPYFTYWKNKCMWRWAVAIFTIGFIGLCDPSLLLAVGALGICLFTVGESTRFDYGSNFDFLDTNGSKYLQILPIDKNKQFSLYFISSFALTIVGVCIIGLCSLTKVYPYSVNAVILFLAIVISFYWIYFVLENMMFKNNCFLNNCRFGYILSLMYLNFLLLVVYYFKTQILVFDKFFLMILVSFIFPFMVALFKLFVQTYSNSKNLELSNKKMENKISQLSRFSKYNLDNQKVAITGFSFWLYQIFITFSNYGKFSMMSLTTVYVLFILLFSISLYATYEYHFNRATYLKLVPISRERMFDAIVYSFVKNIIIILITVGVTLISLKLLFNIQLINFNLVSIGDALIYAMTILLIFYFVTKGFINNDMFFDGIFIFLICIVMVVFYNNLVSYFSNIYIILVPAITILTIIIYKKLRENLYRSVYR
ncbi:hypothetical protein [Anaerorhabdus sp.]|uniref:hypothetical protein n=1 Tax=Anaerorhabdus sp. TaxID=1872524 RepID=UPI002FC9C3BC